MRLLILICARSVLVLLGILSAPGVRAHIMPDKFTLKYQWCVGSLPSAAQYQYQITLSSAGVGEIVMVPGYPTIFDDVPRWRAAVVVKPDRLQLIYDLVKTPHSSDESGKPKPNKNRRRHVASRPTVSSPSVGGPYCRLFIQDGSLGYDLPCCEERTSENCTAVRIALIRAITEAVPNEIWLTLNSRRLAYQKELESEQQMLYK